jgi:conjugative relaxase-like TrwC/TraI family protein
MLRITQSESADAAVAYRDQSLALGDYYGSAEKGKWYGIGAERLGLSGEVNREDFAALAHNRLPSGGRLTARDCKEHEHDKPEKKGRRPGYDFCLSVPKSVSLYVAISDDPLLKKLIEQSVEATIKRIEQDTEVLVQTGGQHVHKKTGNMVIASFHHSVTRPVDGIPDPHDHWHLWVNNSSFDKEENRWKAIEFGNLKKDAPFYEAAFNADLGARLVKNGYPIRRTDRHFELAGVSDSLIRVYSKRSEQVEKAFKAQHRELHAAAAKVVEKTGMAFEDAFAQEKAKLGSKTRAAKTKETVGPGERRAHWISQMTPEQRRSLSTENVKASKSQNLLHRDEAEKLGIDHAFERVSLVRPLRLMGEILKKGIGVLSTRDAEIAIMERGITFPRSVVKVGNLVSIRSVIEEEVQMIRLARDGQGKCSPLGGGKEWIFLDPLVAGDAGQRAAVLHLLTSRDRVMAIRGKAGTGKTTMAKEAVAAIEALSGKKVFLFAPSSGAVEVLRADGLPGQTFQLLNASGELQQAVKGQIILVDEASFLGCKDMRWALQLATDHDCRVVLLGDTGQHRGVNRGDALRVLEEMGAIQSVSLERIYRQKNQQLLSAIEDLSRGQPIPGFWKLDQAGVVQEIRDPNKRLETIASLHLGALREGRTSLVIAPTHNEARAIARVVREAMRKDGLISREDQIVTRLSHLGWTTAQRSDAANYEPGQVVQFHHKAAGYQVNEQWQVVGSAWNGVVLERNGEQRRLPLSKAQSFEVYRPETLSVAIGDPVRVTKNFKVGGEKYVNNSLHTITEITAGAIELDGRSVPRGLLHLDQGIAVTSHASQGKTVDQVIVSAPLESFSQVNREQLYVSMSRARHVMHLITDNKAALRTAIVRSSARLSPALEQAQVHYQAQERGREISCGMER